MRLRHEGNLEDVLVIPMALGFVGTVTVGLYLRWVDPAHEQADLRIRQDERNEIARELHDLVAHHVTGIVLQAQAAQLVSDEHPEVAAEALRDDRGRGQPRPSSRCGRWSARCGRTTPHRWRRPPRSRPTGDGVGKPGRGSRARVDR